MDRTVTITGSNAGQKTLTFAHGDELNAQAGDQITWNIAPGSGVAAITAITPKAGSLDLFKDGQEPSAQNPEKTIWQGTLETDAAVYDVEYYSITWTSVGGGWHGQNVGGIVTDPRITISPGQENNVQ